MIYKDKSSLIGNYINKPDGGLESILPDKWFVTIACLTRIMFFRKIFMLGYADFAVLPGIFLYNL